MNKAAFLLDPSTTFPALLIFPPIAALAYSIHSPNRLFPVPKLAPSYPRSAMGSDSDREAATFFAHLFRTTMSAADISDERQMFNPVIVGVFSGALDVDDGAPPPFSPDRILLVHPLSRRVSVIRGDPAVFFQMLSAGAGRKRHPPASKASIEAMQIVDVVGEGEECAVCLDELGQAVVKEMPCKHRFHGDCIDKWLGLHGTCPVCRYSMPAEESPAKKVGDDVNGDREGVERAVWFEITFGRGGTEDLDLHQEQQIEDEVVDSSSS